MVSQVKLGEMLLAQKIITSEQLNEALLRQKKTGERVGQALIALGFITEKQFLDFFSQQLHIPFCDLRSFQVDPALAAKLSPSYARLYHAVILKETPQGYEVGMSDPLNVPAIDKLRQILRKKLTLALVKEEDLERTLDLVYRHGDEISAFAGELSDELKKKTISVGKAEKGEDADAPIVKLLNTIFEDAAQVNASDIHIEPGEKDIRIRLRVDGILHEQVLEQPAVMAAIASRLKLMSNLNISERRLPQDGRFEMEARKKKYDVRLSTMPTPFGESIVMRLLPQNQEMISLKNTGMFGDVLKQMQEILRKPNGIILVTGPTGSGKSTTLYAAINEIHRPAIKIITIEDPIEYFLPFCVQIQTNEQIGLTFANVLRGILRHDPDVILLGEMRDQETAEIAMRTALTGRLVLSTLHTNDALSAIYRLMDLGVQPYIIGATVQAILAQRLMRLICENCIETVELNERERAWLEGQHFDVQGVTFKKGKGCAYCAQTGYHGRTGVFELLELNDVMAKALRKNDQDAFHESAKESLKGHLLINHAYELVCEGKSTVEEMMRVVNESFA